MPLLEGIQCPVCGAEFAEGDDVVYCPDCGTPHHRECYKMAGHCVNAGLHHTGYNFYDDKIAPKKEEQPEKPVGIFTPQAQEKQTEGETPFSGMFTPIQPEVYTEYEGDSIDGFSTKDYAAAVNSNASRFIPLFKVFDKKERKTSWNWGAFIFGPYYLLFRKMYSQGIGLICIQTVINYLGGYFIALKAPKFNTAMQTLMASSGKGGFKMEDIQAAATASDAQIAANITMIVFAAYIIIRILTALFADKFYFTTIKNLVKNVNDKIRDGATFSAAPGMMVQPMQNLDSDQMKYLYLARRGGASFMAPLMAYLALSLIQMFLQ